MSAPKHSFGDGMLSPLGILDCCPMETLVLWSQFPSDSQNECIFDLRVTRSSRGWYLLPSDARKVVNTASTVVRVLRYPNLSVRKYMSLTLISTVAVSVFAKSYGWERCRWSTHAYSDS